ncbi:MAG: glycosyltransferase family 2 protein [Myxacorys californica WJT36-NPBG1]|jgi:glycosyltransferase involved in cell wall biosynthesis|nr:glycosyltransferase family 2 protein [Myxacorys californica WJT36-NPBG1]
MDSAPLVSVIIPAYNAEVFIAQTLDSVLAQTYQTFEIIVVDDGSRDRTAEIVRSYAERDDRIQLVQQANAGVAAARNLAIQHSHGKYIAPIDADDIWYPRKLEKQVQCLESADASVGLSYAWTVYINAQGAIVARYPVERLGNPEGDVLTTLVFSNFLGHASNPLIRRSCIDHVGGYSPHLLAQGAQGCEDWDLYLRIAEHYEFRVVSEYLIGYRHHDSSMTTNSMTMAKSYHLVMDEIQRRHPEIPVAVHNWGRSGFYNYLLGVSYGSGDYRTALHWLLQGAIADPILLLRPGIYRALFLGSLKLFAQPITTLVWKDHRTWVQFKRQFERQSKPSLASDEIASDEILVMLPERRRGLVWKPYDIWCSRRWQTVMRLNQELTRQKQSEPRIKSGVNG